MRVDAAYLRASSRALSIDVQREAIERAASAREIVIERWYEESRATRSVPREAMNQLRADARAGEVRRVIVHRLDRLGTGVADAVAVLEDLHQHGVEVITLADPFEVGGRGERAALRWAARRELGRAERIEAARERAVREGRRWGRPPRLSEEMASRVLTLRAAGRSLREIAAELGVPKTTVGRALASSRPGVRPVATDLDAPGDA